MGGSFPLLLETESCNFKAEEGCCQRGLGPQNNYMRLLLKTQNLSGAYEKFHNVNLEGILIVQDS